MNGLVVEGVLTEECIRRHKEKKLIILAKGNGYICFNARKHCRWEPPKEDEKVIDDEYTLTKPLAKHGNFFKRLYEDYEWSTYFYYNPYTFEITIKTYDQLWFDRLVPVFDEIFGDDFKIIVKKEFC